MAPVEVRDSWKQHHHALEAGERQQNDNDELGKVWTSKKTSF